MRSFISLLVPLFLLCFSQLLPARQDIDPETGLIIDKGFATVKTHCTLCHSTMLIVQNRASYQGWLDTLRWMQKTQGLQQFTAETEEEILTYLTKNYSPGKILRRTPLTIDNWYLLNMAH